MSNPRRRFRNRPTRERLARRRSGPSGGPTRVPTFVAIDFKTADEGRDSACAVALVRVEGEKIVDRSFEFIRPPRREFAFTHLHGISWGDVAGAPTFVEVWPRLEPMLEGAEFLAAHWAVFDEAVLRACCRAAGLRPPVLRFECTVEWSKRVWGLRTAKLPVVCRHLGLDLVHHQATSDAEACARIMIAARRERSRER